MYPVTTAMQTALDNPANYQMVSYLYELNFSGGVQRLVGMSSAKIWNGVTWSAVGDFRLTGTFRQSDDSSLQNFTIAVCTRDPTWLQRFAIQSKGRLFRWWRCAIDQDGEVVVDPIQRPTMRMTPGKIGGSGDDKFATIVLEDMFNQSRKRAPRTRSHADQKGLFAPSFGTTDDECFYDISHQGGRRPEPRHDHLQAALLTMAVGIVQLRDDRRRRRARRRRHRDRPAMADMGWALRWRCPAAPRCSRPTPETTDPTMRGDSPTAQVRDPEQPRSLTYGRCVIGNTVAWIENSKSYRNMLMGWEGVLCDHGSDSLEGVQFNDHYHVVRPGSSRPLHLRHHVQRQPLRRAAAVELVHGQLRQQIPGE